MMENYLRRFFLFKLCIYSLIMVLNLKAGPGEYFWGPLGFETRDNKIITVYPGSPAAGKLFVGEEVDLRGFNSKSYFGSDFNRLESGFNGGALTITMTNGRKVSLQVPRKGSWSASAPFNCGKCDTLISDAIGYILNTEYRGRTDMRSLNEIALLSTGDARAIQRAKSTLDIKTAPKIAGYANWSNAYRNIALCEYYLMTRDAAVLPMIRRLSETLHKHRNGSGGWGHGPIVENLLDVEPSPNNEFSPVKQVGYGEITVTTLQGHISMLLAEKCGVVDPHITEQNRRVTRYIKSMVGGDVGYSVTSQTINDSGFSSNGKAAMCAIALALEGEIEDARYFIGLSIAGKDELLIGHTGPYFGQIWTGLGVALAGNRASTLFFNETHWLRTNQRRWDGGARHFSSKGLGYSALSEIPANILSLSHVRNKLLITGRAADSRLRFSDTEVNLAFEDLSATTVKDFAWVWRHRNNYNPNLRRESAKAASSYATNAQYIRWVEQSLVSDSLIDRVGAYDFLRYSQNSLTSTVAERLMVELTGIMNDPGEHVRYRSWAAECLLGGRFKQKLREEEYFSILDFMMDDRLFPDQFYNFRLINTFSGGKFFLKKLVNRDASMYTKLIRYFLDSPFGEKKNSAIKSLREEGTVAEIQLFIGVLNSINEDDNNFDYTYPGRHRNNPNTLAALQSLVDARDVKLGETDGGGLAGARVPSGYKAYYSFSDSKNIGKDDSGNGHDLMSSEVNFTASGRSGGGAAFTSNDSKLVHPSIRLGANWTVSAWFEGLDSDGWRTLFRGASYHHVIVNFSQEDLGLFRNGHRDSGVNLRREDGVWRMVTAVGTSNKVDYYIDGKLVGTVSGHTVDSDVQCIGNFQNGGQRFADTLDEVYLYDRGLSSEEVAGLYIASAGGGDFGEDMDDGVVVPPGYTAYYSFNDSNNVGKDDSGNGFNLKSSDVNFTNVGGSKGGASFTNRNSKLEHSGIPLGGSWTVSAWYEGLGTGGWRTLFRGTRFHHVIVNFNEDDLGLFRFGHRGSGMDLKREVGVWHMVTAVGTANKVEYYIDGRFVGSVTGFTVDSDVKCIGNFQGGGQRFADTLDEVYLYSRQLNAAEITDLYKASARKLQDNDVESGNGNDVVQHVLPEGVKAYYSFNDVNNIGKDDSGNGYDLMANGVDFTSAGISQGGASFVNDNSKLDHIGIPLGGSWTVSAWYEGLDENGWRTLFRGSRHHHVIVNYDASDLGLFHFGHKASGMELRREEGIWRMVTAVGTANKVDYYIDGKLVGTVTGFTVDTNVQCIGNYQGGRQRFADTLDEVYLYDRKLSAAEVTALFHTSRPSRVVSASAVIGSARPVLPDASSLDVKLVSQDIVKGEYRIEHRSLGAALNGAIQYEWSDDLVNWYKADGRDAIADGTTVSVDRLIVGDRVTLIAKASRGSFEFFFRVADH